MLFYLTTLNLARFLHEEAPALKEGESDRQVVAAVDAWKHSDFLCRNYILNGLDNMLYNVYSPLKTAKELWDSLEKKYKTEDAGTKKFVKFKGKCYNCGKTGHRASDCRRPKKNHGSTSKKTTN
ncbi:hypothetical protein CsSME_00044888 [Camellia sinensis var. sinensis]